MVSNVDGKKMYEGLVGRADSYGLLMPDEEIHRQRLMLASQILDMTVEDLVARGWIRAIEETMYLDLGCGFGDLLKHYSISPERYTGVEEVDWIRQEAMERHPDHTFIKVEARRYLQSLFEDLTHNARMTHRKARRPFDIVLALGVVATMKNTEVKTLIKMIEQLKPHAMLLSFLERDRYTGPLSSFQWKEVTHMLSDHKGLDSVTIASVNPNDPTERLMVVMYDWEYASA